MHSRNVDDWTDEPSTAENTCTRSVFGSGNIGRECIAIAAPTPPYRRQTKIAKPSRQEMNSSSPASDDSRRRDHQFDQRVNYSSIARTQSPRSGQVWISPLGNPTLGQVSDLEVVLSSASSWTLAKLESAYVTEDPMSRYLAWPERLSMTNTRNMYRMLEMVFDLWHQQKGSLAGMAARMAFLALEQAL